MISRENIQEHLTNIRAHILRVLKEELEQDGMVPLRAFIISQKRPEIVPENSPNANASLFITAITPTEDTTKDAFADTVRQHIRENKAEAVLVTYEAFYSDSLTLDGAKKRDDVLFAHYEDCSLNVHAQMALITTDREGRHVGDFTDVPTEGLYGRFTRWFPGNDPKMN